MRFGKSQPRHQLSSVIARIQLAILAMPHLSLPFFAAHRHAGLAAFFYVLGDFSAATVILLWTALNSQRSPQLYTIKGWAVALSK